jgi:hypothetical protein
MNPNARKVSVRFLVGAMTHIIPCGLDAQELFNGLLKIFLFRAA